MNSKKRILSFLLALVMVFGSFPSVFAEGISDQTAQREKTVEIEGKNDGRKLVFNLQEKTNSLRKASTLANGPRRAPADGPGYEENNVKVKINLSGVNGKDFPFATIFPDGAKVKLELLDMDTFETKTVEKDFTADGQEIDFGIYQEDQIQNITIQLADNVNIAGKIIENTTSGTGGHVGTTVFNLYLYQYVNTDVKVTTVDEAGSTTTNPTTAATNGKIKVTAGQEEKEIEIPAETNDTETFLDKDVNVANISNFQSSPKVEVTGLNDKSVLVDKANNKVYKKTEVKVDQNGINPTEIKFTEKPIWTTDDKSGDTDYVAVTFNQGEHGTIATNKTYYVFKGVEMESELAAPDVTANGGYQFTGWDPALVKKYDAATEHVAQYTQKTIAEQVTALGGLKPVTIKVWKGDKVDWADGVAPKTTNTADSELVYQLLANATVTEKTQPARTSAEAGKKEGTLLVTFGDGSTLEVDSQWLYVWEHIVKVDPNDPNSPSEDDLPKDKIPVLFVASTGVKKVNTTGTTYVKEGTVFQDTDFPQEKDITFKDGYKGPVAWIPADHTVKRGGPAFNKRGQFVFRASATKETTADIVKKNGGLKGVDFAAWVGDLEELTDATAKSNFWKKGVAANTTDNTKKATIDAALAEATVEDTTETARTTNAKGTFPGTLKVTFKDGSVYEVEAAQGQTPANTNIEQKLYVYDKKDVVPTDPTQPTPEDAVVVTYNKDDGVKELKGTGKTLVKSGETLTDDDFPTATLEEGHKDVTWSGQTADNPKDYTVTENNKVFTATADKTVVPTDPENPNPGKDQVTVTFLQGAHGTLSGIDKDGNNVTKAEKLAFNVKKTATWKDMAKYIPTAVAEGEWKVADEKWDPQLPAEGTTVTAGTYTAQYAEDKTVVPTADKDKYDPNYENGKGKPGTTVTIPAPTFKDSTDKTVEKPTEGTKTTTFTKNDDKQTNVTVNPDTGSISVEIPADAEVGSKITIPVDVTYPDGSKETVDVIVTVTEEETPGKPEPKPDDKPSAPAITWGGYWFLGNQDTEPVEELERGSHFRYIYGYVDKTVRPEGMITRSEAAAMIARLAGLDMSDKSKPAFKDTPSAWYNTAINAMVKKDLMFADKDGNFRPNEPITRGEFARALYYIDHKSDKIAPFADVKGHVYEDAINQAYGNGRIAGYPDGTFKPEAKIQRAEAARILNRFAGRSVQEKGIADYKARLIHFTDLPTSHWAYYEIVEAANSHRYHRMNKYNIEEMWTGLLD